MREIITKSPGTHGLKGKQRHYEKSSHCSGKRCPHSAKSQARGVVHNLHAWDPAQCVFSALCCAVEGWSEAPHSTTACILYATLSLHFFSSYFHFPWYHQASWFSFPRFSFLFHCNGFPPSRSLGGLNGITTVSLSPCLVHRMGSVPGSYSYRILLFYFILVLIFFLSVFPHLLIFKSNFIFSYFIL